MSYIPSGTNNPPAEMGFIGYVRFQGVTGLSQLIRARSADLMLRQSIDAPDIIDGRYDRTIYQLGAFEVGGGIEFPAIYGVGNCTYSPAGALFSYAVCRSGADGLLKNFDTMLRYTNGANSFLYKQCIINQYTFSVEQQAEVNISLDLIATYRESTSSVDVGATETPVTRVVTWNDAFVEIGSGNGNDPLEGRSVRSFEVSFNNNAERYYTLNGTLFPQAIAPRKRDITGNFRVLGRSQSLSNWALSNQTRCSEDQNITFGYGVVDTANCCGDFRAVLPNIVYQIEELSLTNDLFETTVNFRSLPDTGEQLLEGSSGIPSC